ncbi:extracellular catalytic domain type 2 short-chain-length polyhydroxyalkanoate depolymerase [Paracoccus litorisediminis]|jgi:poly(3-hydroxybutyrate) depolymerase|uniref:Poly(3-hydroxybutyrate) depolymerase n=1 Tax=Paracoccus litorisediminis TaxID=2006130 RepID=A0A844HVR8_9RHOB|nr:hypothetical protein [Paracoccus litorisediminis]MTH62427.1 hypothetical protein [Paracoccus litorisediminis]
MRFSGIFAASLLCATAPGMATYAQDLLTALKLAPQVTGSGLSSGAFMTVQLQTAFSAKISGVGVIAGGPFYCAGGYSKFLFGDPIDLRTAQAVAYCLNPTEALPYVPLWSFTTASIESRIMARIRILESRGSIDPSSNIIDDRIYMFLGTEDPIVRTETMGMLRNIYEEIGVPDSQIEFDQDVPAGHSFVTDLGDVPCAETEPDYLNLCDADGQPGGPAIDQAQQIFGHLYEDLRDEVEPVAANLMTFDQSAYSKGAMGMDPKAYVYIPTACKNQTTECRLHIALHGCSQGRSWELSDGTLMGERYATLTGYNGWAEANNLVVLYPQAIAVPAPAFLPTRNNPKGCWDWWGYGGEDYLSKKAPQMAAIARMAAALGSPLE